jgi:hypothetical protein
MIQVLAASRGRGRRRRSEQWHSECLFCFDTNEQSPAVCNVPGSPSGHLAEFLLEFLRDCDGKAMARGME